MTTEQKALALVNAVLEGLGFALVDHAYIDRRSAVHEALCRAIEAHEADKKAFSDAAVKCRNYLTTGALSNAFDALSPFILPEPEPDPLVEVFDEVHGAQGLHDELAARFRQALAVRGYKIEMIDNA